MLALSLGSASFVNHKQQQFKFPFIQRLQPMGRNCVFLTKCFSMGLKHPGAKSLHIISSCLLFGITRYCSWTFHLHS